MSDALKTIMINAIRIRMKRDEKLDDILAGYKKLSGDDKETLRKAIVNIITE